MAIQNALCACEGSVLDANHVSDLNIRVRFDFAGKKAFSKSLHVIVRNWKRLAGRRDDRYNPRCLENTQPLTCGNAHEGIAREKRYLQLHSPPVSPPSLRS